MQITDSSRGHRKITLAVNEALDSTTVIAALVLQGRYNRQQATELVAQMYDAVESHLMDMESLAA